MPVDTSWAVNLWLSISTTAQSDPITWSTLLDKLQQLVPNPWFWIILGLIGAAILFLLDVGDKLFGILSWFGIERPFRRSMSSESVQQKTRHQLLPILQREIDYRLATSLHERVKLDLYMEDQRQRVGNYHRQIVPSDRPQVSSFGRTLLN